MACSRENFTFTFIKRGPVAVCSNDSAKLACSVTWVIPVVILRGDVFLLSVFFCPLPDNRIFLEGDGAVSR